MNTPAHLILSAVIFARPYERSRTLAALAGALTPDLSLYLMGGVALFIMGLSPNYVFGTLYFSEAWQMVFAVDNSFILWGLALAVCWWRAWTNGMVFAISGLLHLALDFLLHHDDARRQFWPITNWVFQSPLSYWDRAYYGGVIGPIEMALSVLFSVILFWRFSSLRSRSVIVSGLALQVAPVFVWAYVFAGGH